MPHKLLVDAPHALSDADLIVAQDLLTTLDVEMLPQDPRLPPDALVSLMRAQPSHTSLRLIRVVDDSGDVVAAAQCRMSMLSNGDRTLGVGGGVHPDHRKSGLAWTLLRAAVEVAQQADRSLLAFTTVDTGWTFGPRTERCSNSGSQMVLLALRTTSWSSSSKPRRHRCCRCFVTS